MPELALFQNYIELKFFQISKFGAERQILIFEITSNLVSPQLKFEELQLINFKPGFLATKWPNLATLAKCEPVTSWQRYDISVHSARYCVIYLVFVGHNAALPIFL